MHFTNTRDEGSERCQDGRCGLDVSEVYAHKFHYGHCRVDGLQKRGSGQRGGHMGTTPGMRREEVRGSGHADRLLEYESPSPRKEQSREHTSSLVAENSCYVQVTSLWLPDAWLLSNVQGDQSSREKPSACPASQDAHKRERQNSDSTESKSPAVYNLPGVHLPGRAEQRLVCAGSHRHIHVHRHADDSRLPVCA